MILFAGIPSEPPLELAIAAAERIGEPYVLFSQRKILDARMNFRVAPGGCPTGWLELDGEGWPLEVFSGVYTRYMDYRLLPEVKRAADPERALGQAERLHHVFTQWSELAPCTVVNRVSAMGSNNAKPYQASFIAAAGFDLPETLVTNDPDLVREFRARHGDIIYKSISGARSIVTTLGLKDESRLPMIRWCPVQFQEQVKGYDVRVHVLGAEVFATRIHSEATDYRYAGAQVGESARLEPYDLPAEIAARCIRLTADLGLLFSGIDLLFAKDGRCICFEANPCPGYSYYEANTGQPISEALVRLLAADPPRDKAGG